MNECVWIVSVMMVMREDWSAQRKICPSTVLSTTNLTCPAWDRTWTSVATDHELIVWTMAWLVLCLCVCRWYYGGDHLT